MSVSVEARRLLDESQRRHQAAAARTGAMRTPDDHSNEAGTGRVQEVIAEIRRLWILAATAKICFAQGPEAVSFAAVAARSGIPRTEVAARFADPDALLRATFQRAAAAAAEYAIPRFAAEIDPVERSRLASAHLLAFSVAEPELAWMCVVDCAATRRARANLLRTLSRMVTDWFAGYLPVGEREQLVRPFAELMDAVARQLRHGCATGLGELHPRIVEAVLTPFVGAGAARVVADRPPPEVSPPEAPRGPRGERLTLDLRLTADLLDELKALGA